MANRIPPDTRADTDTGHLTDHTDLADILTAMGRPFDVTNWAYGPADNTGGTAVDSIFAAVVSAAHTAGRPVLIPKGTYKVTGTQNWMLAGLQVIGEGAQNVEILQETNGIPIVQVAGQGQTIAGIKFAYATAQGSSNTGGIGITFGDDTAGSCFLSRFIDLYVQNAYTGLGVNPAVTSAAGLFSCYFNNLHVLGWYNHAIGLDGNAGLGGANCTGCVFDNTYLHNNTAGSPLQSHQSPIFLESWDEIVFNQLNVEHLECFISDVIQLSGVGIATINGLHLESVQLSGSSGNAAYIGLVGGHSGVIVNGLTVRFCTMTGTTDNSVVRFGADNCSAQINGLNEASDADVSGTPIHPYADFGGFNNCTLRVGSIVSTQANATEIGNTGTGSYSQIDAPRNYGGMFGDGSDGAATLDGTATVAWASKSGSTYTMTRSAHLTSLTINSGVTLKPSGNPIFCKGTVTNAGTITADGTNASAATGGITSGSSVYVGGRPGHDGGTGAGAAGTAGAVGVGAAGAGGAGTSGSGGAGGTTVTTGTYYFRNPMTALTGLIMVAAVQILTGAPGGGSGAGDGTNSGGGGGGGGGPIVIFAWVFINTGTLTAKGGTGGTPTTGNCGSGGGGTGGLILVYTLVAWTQSGTLTLTAGSPGAKTGTGVNGSSGSAGFSLNEVVV